MTVLVDVVIAISGGGQLSSSKMKMIKEVISSQSPILSTLMRRRTVAIATENDPRLNPSIATLLPVLV
jgi:hypothetical protein